MAASRLNLDSDLEAKLVQAALQDPLLVAEGFDSSRVFSVISVLLNSPSAPKEQLIRQIKTVYLFHITRSDGTKASWWVDMKKQGRVMRLEDGKKGPLKPNVVIECSDNDLVALATGRANPQKLYFAKKIRVRGNVENALKVERILTHEREKLDKFAPSIAGNRAPGNSEWMKMNVPVTVKSKL